MNTSEAEPLLEKALAHLLDALALVDRAGDHLIAAKIADGTATIEQRLFDLKGRPPFGH